MSALSRRGALAGVAALAAGAAPAAALPANPDAAFIARVDAYFAALAALWIEEEPWMEVTGGPPDDIAEDHFDRHQVLIAERTSLLLTNVHTLPGLRAKARLAMEFLDEGDDGPHSDNFGAWRLLQDINRLLPA